VALSNASDVTGTGEMFPLSDRAIATIRVKPLVVV